jgi:MFS family permease
VTAEAGGSPLRSQPSADIAEPQISVPVAATDGRASRTGKNRSAFHALRFPLFRLLWVNALVFIFAVTSQGIARSWLAYQITGDNKGLGGVQVTAGIAMLVGTPIGGLLADRIDRRRIVIAMVSLVAISSFWIGLTAVTHSTEYWMLVVSSGLQGLAFAFYSPARVAMISNFVDSDAMSDAVLVTQLGYAGMLTVGPALSGLLIGVPGIGAPGVFFGSGTMCALAALSSLRLPRTKPSSSGQERTSFLTDAHEAIAFIRSSRQLSLLAVTSLVTVFIACPYQAFLPYLAHLFHGQSSLFGAMSGLTAAGSVTAGFVVTQFSSRVNLAVIYCAAGFSLGIGLITVGLAQLLWLTLIFLFIVGGSVLSFQTANQAMIMKRSPEALHGRLQAVVLLGSSGNGLMALPLGALADVIGLHTTLAIMGSVALMVASIFATRASRTGLFVSAD